MNFGQASVIKQELMNIYLDATIHSGAVSVGK